MDEAKKYSVTILGNTYVIRSDESEQQIRQASALLDAYAKNFVEKTRTVDQKTTALLVALQLASELVHSNHRNESCQTIVDNLVKKIDYELSGAV
jgi:cell division protein ZapA (FtsZ GTPase activity inhibitor)